MSDFGGDSADVEVLYDVPYAHSNGKGNVHDKGYLHGGGGGQYTSARSKDRGVGKRLNPQAKVMSSHVDFENVFDPFERDQDDVREFFDDSSEEKNDDGNDDWEKPTMFNDPRKDGVLNEAVHQIAGSPWAKPPMNATNRPQEPLSIALYTSMITFFLTIALVGGLFFMAIWNNLGVGRTIVECFLAIVAFIGLFWNVYFTVSSIMKCFIPARAFRSNTKYCSVIPENKPKHAEWMDVTIQIPVYKESLQEVLMPTLKSCMISRDHYAKKSGAMCNIVLCDDGMMAYLKNNFAAAEMLWETIVATKGKYFKLSELLGRVPKPSRRHLKGLSSKAVYEVFHRMLYYYHNNIGFVARSTYDRRGKFKKASNLNSHLRLAWGAEQLSEADNMSFEDALIENSHNSDGSRFIMFGGDIRIGELQLINDADARMAETVIIKTVPEFLNDKHLGFTQHATKTLDDQRRESFYINMLSAYTDALYMGHFLLSSILGCHPPLVGHSIILRSEAVKSTGRIRTLRKAQRWLNNIGLPFLSVDQIGSYNLQDNGTTEYWSECHVSEDFELMIHLYNLGFNGRYVNYPDCEFQEGITRTFDEEAGRHRKFALGAHELIFKPFNSWIGQGPFSELFQMFIRSDIPSYYKVFLTSYLFGYTSGGCYIFVFSTAAIARIVGIAGEIKFISGFDSAGVLVLSVVVYYIIGYTTFLIAMVKMKWANNNLLFPEYRNSGVIYLCWRLIRYCMMFQMSFYTVMGNYFFLGSMDHLMSRPNICSATNKDSIKITRWIAFKDMVRFNIGSWGIAIYLLGLCYLVVLKDANWQFDKFPDSETWLYTVLFAGPAAFLALAAFYVPILLNPFILGWPFNPPLFGRKSKSKWKADKENRHKSVDLNTFMEQSNTDTRLNKEIGRVGNKPDVELGSLATNDFHRSNMTTISPPMNHHNEVARPRKRADKVKRPQALSHADKQRSAREENGNFTLAMI
eukprot:CAMPEP_0197177242 /NCGR_PEP_ID=MMETSP1423-20130617/2920_1 /TAXON_ID=476441 /ORGANISM="Pseudo-nitzschia heimii, Strain UNC1101" /LENGTH=971 /DNA_ID=CAMNT_0042626765 /DNA_START=206 /DNA_END=3121 /DNA_ORIENTATION=-